MFKNPIIRVVNSVEKSVLSVAKTLDKMVTNHQKETAKRKKMKKIAESN